MLFLEKPDDPRGKQIGYSVGPILAGATIGGLFSLFAPRSRVVTTFLAGFCLSMWFMCLKSGGLVPTTAGKTVFIFVMTALVGITQFFKLTRGPAQLVSVTFTGSTALILGVDCFTRAGLKEFWLYIWGNFTHCPTRLLLLTRSRV
jgi:hypothetical protein